jgi:hypothetical protein
VVVKGMGQCGNHSFYERFLNIYFNNYGPYLSRGRVLRRQIWVKSMWDVWRSADCRAWRKSRDARRGAGHETFRGTQGAGFDVDHGTQGAALNRGTARNEGARGKDDFPVGTRLRSIVGYAHVLGRIRGKVPAHVTQFGTLPQGQEGSREVVQER